MTLHRVIERTIATPAGAGGRGLEVVGFWCFGEFYDRNSFPGAFIFPSFSCALRHLAFLVYFRARDLPLHKPLKVSSQAQQGNQIFLHAPFQTKNPCGKDNFMKVGGRSLPLASKHQGTSGDFLKPLGLTQVPLGTYFLIVLGFWAQRSSQATEDEYLLLACKEWILGFIISRYIKTHS